jgi:hypothetical protein
MNSAKPWPKTGSSIELLFFDDLLSKVICVTAERGFENAECFSRHASAGDYGKIDVPFPIWKITLAHSTLIVVDNLKGSHIQKCFTLCLTSGKRTIGEIGPQVPAINNGRTWVSSFMSSACEAEAVLCVYAQEVITMPSGGGVVEYSIGQLNLKNFTIKNLTRLATPYG